MPAAPMGNAPTLAQADPWLNATGAEVNRGRAPTFPVGTRHCRR
jgi:hypothetical protein